MEFLPSYSNQVFLPKNIPFIGLRTFAMAEPYTSHKKHKVVFVLGSTGTGKSKLAIDLAMQFNGDIVNSDKIQVHDGLHVITNKVTEDECAGIPHHLIGGVHPEADFTASDFRREALRAVESIVSRGRLPVVAGGSNSYIEELVDGDGGRFRSKYESVFIWVDVDPAVLDAYVSVRVERMVEMGSVEEAREMFDPEGDYSRGIRRAIGVPEMDSYFRAEGSADEETKARMLRTAVGDIKANTCKLACRQRQKIRRLSMLAGWDLQRVDATEAFAKKGEEAVEAWERVVRGPSVQIVYKFLYKDDVIKNNETVIKIGADCVKDPAVAAAGGGGGGCGGGIRTSNYCGSATSTAAALAIATAMVGSTH